MGENGSRISGCPEHIALSRTVAGEGMVLLENKGILPLREGTRGALFGVGTLEYVQVGGGSGRVYPAYVRNIYEGFLEKAPRISIYEPLSRFYYDYAVSRIDALDEKELLAVAQQVMSREDLKYCPHGRPICVTLSKKQLEKQFKRT